MNKTMNVRKDGSVEGTVELTYQDGVFHPSRLSFFPQYSLSHAK